MQLRWQSTGCVDQNNITSSGFASRDGVKTHGRRIATRLADDLNGIALCPDCQLLACCSPKGVGCCQQNAGALFSHVVREFADGSCFASAVDARHHDDHGLLIAYDQLFSSGSSKSVMASVSKAFTTMGSVALLAFTRAFKSFNKCSVALTPVSAISRTVSSSS